MGLRRSFLALAMARIMSSTEYACATTTWPMILRRLNSSNDSRLRQAMAPSSSNQQKKSPTTRSTLSTSSTSSACSSSMESPLHLRYRDRVAGPSVTSRRDWRRRGVPRCTSQGEGFVGSLPFPSPAMWERGAVAGIRGRIGVVTGTAARQVKAIRGAVTMAQPRKKMPERSVNVFCQKCRTQLYKYKKGGKGSLVKCYKERIVEDFTDGKLECPSCGQLFARDTMVHGRPAFKMIGGKVYQKK